MPQPSAGHDHTTDEVQGRARWVGLLVFLLLAFAAGFVGNLLQGDDVGPRYLALDRPGWAPPREAFGLVWPVLYAFIGIAGWRVWTAAGSWRPARVPLTLWVVQLAVNASWTGVFFGLSAFVPAIAVIAVLDVLVVATIVTAARFDRLAAGLLVPYLLWILYATALNVAIAALN